MNASQDMTTLSTRDLDIHYGSHLAVRSVSLDIPTNRVTALIGPSGCGKSSVLRCFNRLNDLIPSFRLEGSVTFNGQDLYAREIDPIEVRRRIGMVFQKANPFPKSIFANVAFGAEVTQFSGNMEELVESCLRRAALWDEVKEKLEESGLSLSGGQRQRLCIARALAAEPEVLLMDEPCSALDPLSTKKIEELILELKEHYTIAIVTHNLAQARRVADYTAFFNTEETEAGEKVGYLAEFDETETIFESAQHQVTRDYVSGRFG
jgi:phosphate transport system ATP-binding protein